MQIDSIPCNLQGVRLYRLQGGFIKQLLKSVIHLSMKKHTKSKQASNTFLFSTVDLRCSLLRGKHGAVNRAAINVIAGNLSR